MKLARVTATLLLTLVLFVSLTPTAPPVHAKEPLTFQGHLRYSERGPGASSDGIGTALFVGGIGGPVAAARLLSGLRAVLSLPGIADNPSIKSINDLLNQGVPLDVAALIPGTATYDATVAFSLKEGDDGVIHLREGTLSWTNTNHFEFTYDGGSIVDSFGGSGSYTLDPSKDKIDLSLNTDKEPYTFDLEVSISHPAPTNGNSVWNALGGAVVMQLESANGQQTMSGQAMGQIIPPEEVGGGVPEHGIYYSRHGTLSELQGSETWRNLLDAQVLVNYAIFDQCNASIMVPSENDNLTFEDDAAGTLKVEAEADVSPQAWGDDLTWTFPEINGSDLTADPEDKRGDKVTFTYKGLPEDNAAFGRQEVSVAFEEMADRCDDPQERNVRFFWPREAKNSPDSSVPNWFYYWGQTRAAQGHKGSILFDSSCPRNPSTGQVKWYGYYSGFGDASKTNVIYLCEWGPNHFESVNPLTGKYVEGIDHYASVVLHEWTHLENHNDWWGETGYEQQRKPGSWNCASDPPENDGDCDSVPDDREAAYGLNPLMTDTHGIGMPDCEVPPYLQENTWPNGSANREDWADPGKQTGGS